MKSNKRGVLTLSVGTSMHKAAQRLIESAGTRHEWVAVGIAHVDCPPEIIAYCHPLSAGKLVDAWNQHRTLLADMHRLQASTSDLVHQLVIARASSTNQPGGSR